MEPIESRIRSDMQLWVDDLTKERDSLREENERLKSNNKMLARVANHNHDCAARLREALEELADLVDEAHKGGYATDSFTTQPARAALGEK